MVWTSKIVRIDHQMEAISKLATDPISLSFRGQNLKKRESLPHIRREPECSCDKLLIIRQTELRQRRRRSRRASEAAPTPPVKPANRSPRAPSPPFQRPYKRERRRGNFPVCQILAEYSVGQVSVYRLKIRTIERRRED